MFPLISTPGVYLSLNLSGATLIEGQCLKVWQTYLKVRGISQIKLTMFITFEFWIATKQFL